jgi:hypothetical protein
MNKELTSTRNGMMYFLGFWFSCAMIYMASSVTMFMSFFPGATESAKLPKLT